MRWRTSKLLAAFAAAVVCACATAADATALESCPSQATARTIYSAAGGFESIAFDRKGRLFFTNSSAGELLMIRRAGAKPKVVLDGIDGPGGIVFRRNGHVLVGFGDNVAQGSDGPANPEAGLIDVNPRNGRSKLFVEGLQMANGVTRGPGGQIFASTDFGTGVDRILGGAVELAWAPLDSSNGMVVDRRKKFLFVNQTFTPTPTIARVPLDDPTASIAWFSDAGEAGAFLDGLTRDADGNLYAAANGSGAVWKVSGRRDGCILWQGPPFPRGPSDLAFGRGKGRFAKGSLFATTFGGELLQLRHAR